MAKVVKDTRETIDVDLELSKIESKKKISEKKKQDKKKDSKKSKSTTDKKKHSKRFTFFKEVKSEISKVKWPSKKDMLKYSVATIVFILECVLFSVSNLSFGSSFIFSFSSVVITKVLFVAKYFTILYLDLHFFKQSSNFSNFILFIFIFLFIFLILFFFSKI